MRMRIPSGLFAVLLVVAPAAAEAAVEVSFVSPERYADAGRYPGDRPSARAGALRELALHLEKLGATRLPANQTLRIEVLNVDLAGRFEPWRAFAYDVRILRQSTWPRMSLRFVLEQEGREIERGREKLSDLSYLDRPHSRLDGDPLRCEKAMLEDWFRARFTDAPR